VTEIFVVKTNSDVLERVFLKSDEGLWTLTILDDNFPQGRTYTYSLWMFTTYQGDPEVYVCVWGPGLDGHTYQVEFCSAAAGRSYIVTWLSNSETFQDNLVVPVSLY